MIGKDPLISTAGLHLVADKQTNKQAQKQTRKLRTMIGKDPLISTAGLHLVADKQTIKQELR